MPIQTTRDEMNTLTEHVVTGVLADEEMFACQEEFYAAGATPLELWDMSDADLSQITVAGMQKFISSEAHLGKARQGGKSAVITKTSLQYGLGRMAEILGEFESLPFGFRVFRKREDAVAWLNEAP